MSSAPPGEINGDLWDRFTLAHLAVGGALGYLRTPLALAVAAGVGWELIERPLKEVAPELFPHSTQDSLPNAIGDVGAVLAGWFIASKLNL